MIITNLETVVKEYTYFVLWKNYQYIIKNQKIKIDWSGINVTNTSRFLKMANFNKSKSISKKKIKCLTNDGKVKYEEKIYFKILLKHYFYMEGLRFIFDLPTCIKTDVKASTDALSLNLKFKTESTGKLKFQTTLCKPSNITKLNRSLMTRMNKEFHSGFLIQSMFEGFVKIQVNDYLIEESIQNILKQGLPPASTIESSNNIKNYEISSDGESIVLNALGIVSFQYVEDQEFCNYIV